jgi:hypothetical protein
MPAMIPTMAMTDLSIVRAPEHIPPLSSFLELVPLLQLDPEACWDVALIPQSMNDSITLEQFAQPQEPMALHAMPCI